MKDEKIKEFIRMSVRHNKDGTIMREKNVK